MLIDFGRGDRREIPACTVLAAEHDPDGRPRTVFYSSPRDGVILRQGQSGRVQGSPSPGTPACYGVDGFGRMALTY